MSTSTVRFEYNGMEWNGPIYLDIQYLEMTLSMLRPIYLAINLYDPA